MNERIHQMSEYVLNNDIYPSIVPVDYDPDDEALPEALKTAKHLREYMLAQTVRIDSWTELVGLLKFDGSVVGNLFQRTGHTKFDEARDKYYLKPVNNLITFEWQHSSPNFSPLLEYGMKGYLDRINKSLAVHAANPQKQYFLMALSIACDAITQWSDKCARECLAHAAEEADSERKEKLRKMAKTLRRVPREGARTFEEAIQSIYLCFHFLPDSLGLPDRYLLPYYRRDTESGILTRDHAKELLQELFTMINGFTVFNSPQADKGGESHFAIGGYLPNHEDGYNELSDLILESMMELPYCRPQVSLRWTEKLPFEKFRHVLDVERHDKYKRIAIVNDEVRIPSMMERGHLLFKDACEYMMVGCNEASFPGTIDLGGSNSNVARSLTRTLYERTNEVVECQTFDEFYEVYKRELLADLAEMHEYISLFNALRSRDINVISSLFMDGCIERGLSATQGGCERTGGGTSLMGYICTIDSLCILNQYVYEEKRISMADMIEILRSNWEGHEDLRAEILQRGQFTGNNYESSNRIAQQFTNTLHEYTYGQRGLFTRGTGYGTLTGYNPHYAWFGNTTLATPDGRHNGDPFGVGCGQNDGKDREGMTALLASVSKMDPHGVTCGANVFNLKVEPSIVYNDENFEKFVRVLDTYFRMKGPHLQLNYVSAEELLDALKNPEQYKSLRVRVSGFSAYFTTLNPGIQQDVIRRTTVGL